MTPSPSARCCTVRDGDTYVLDPDKKKHQPFCPATRPDPTPTAECQAFHTQLPESSRGPGYYRERKEHHALLARQKEEITELRERVALLERDWFSKEAADLYVNTKEERDSLRAELLSARCFIWCYDRDLSTTDKNLAKARRALSGGGT